ncbi:MotA/TolQ/ExbB proton channel family protein (plasmid) [Streptomyces sp. L7]|uniref:SCO6880 family protein n=1 Tax=Actinomycetes TaxID=1760 RepID=UPI00389A83A7
MAAVDTTHEGPRTYGNWRPPTSAGLLGLGSVGTGLLFVALLAILIALMSGGFLAALITAAIAGGLMLMLLLKNADGRSALSRVSNRIGWVSARSRGTHLYRSGPLGRTEWGTYQLPGVAAATRLSEHTDSYGRLFALVYTPISKTYAVVIGTEPDGASLVDPMQIDTWVADWGHWLSNLAEEPGIEGASVTIETAPESGTRLRREVELNLDPDAPAFAQAMLHEVIDTYPAGSSTVKAFVTLTFSAVPRKGAPARKPDEMARELAARLPGLTGDLQATGAGAAHPLSAQELCETIRVAYDPAAAQLIDEAHAQGETPELTWPDVGPTAHQASWSDYRHDSATSITWAMTQAPRGMVQSGVLARLLAPHRDIARKRVTILYKPIDPGRAAGLVEADLNAAQVHATATRKPQARSTLAVRAAAATAQEEASGAGLVNFAVLLTATVLDPAKEPEAAAAIDNLSASARLRVRRVYGSQDSAFAMALPLGLIPTKHVQVPSMIRDRL